MSRNISLRSSMTVLGLLLLASTASAGESWLFRPSYYTHDPSQGVAIRATPPGGPLFSRPQGLYVRSGYRNLHSTIVVGGTTVDHLRVWDAWVQSGAQY